MSAMGQSHRQDTQRNGSRVPKFGATPSVDGVRTSFGQLAINHETQEPTPAMTATERGLATGLGLFSLGLGFAELAFPAAVSEAIGVDASSAGWMRAFGAREIGAGIGLLASKRPAAAMWSRVAGDVMDLTALGVAIARARDGQRTKTGAAAALVAGVLVLDVASALMLSRPPRAVPVADGKEFMPSFIINKSPAECAQFLASHAEQFAEITPTFSADARGATRATLSSKAGRETLRKFKQLLETNEIPTTKGQAAGPRGAIGTIIGGLEQ